MSIIVPTPHESAAVAWASQVARQQGLSFTQARILQSSSTVVIHFQPTAVVARVSGGTTSQLRPGVAWFTRELAIAQHLAQAGAPAIAPSDLLSPGPYAQTDSPTPTGLVLSFWQWVQERPQPPSPESIGQGLRACHQALVSYPPQAEPLQIWGGLREAEQHLQTFIASEAIAPRQTELLQAIAQHLRDCLPQSSLQPIHGDAHLLNVLNTSRGVLWCDWEDTFLGPVEFDLASLVAAPRIFGQHLARAEAVLANYGDRFDPALLELCVVARTFLVVVWTLQVQMLQAQALQAQALQAQALQTSRDRVDPIAQARIARRLAWLSDYIGYSS